MTTSTPDLAFMSNDLVPKRDTCTTALTRNVQDQLAGSDHRPVLLSVDVNPSKTRSNTTPRWNYKKADWIKFSSLSNNYTSSINSKTKQIDKSARAFVKAILKAAQESIPRGARKDYLPYWTEEIQKLNDEVTRARELVEENPTIENNISLKAKTAKLKKETLSAMRSSWNEKTSTLNLEKDGNKLWSLVKNLNSEENKQAPIAIEKDGKILSQPATRTALLNQFKTVSNTGVSQSRRAETTEETKKLIQWPEEPQDEIMTLPITHNELESALQSLKPKQAPGPDGVTNELLIHLGPEAKKKLLQIYNASWKHGIVPQEWKKAILIPIHKPGKPKNSPSSYRPISLTSCLCKLLERILNSRLMWFMEKERKFNDEQAGFRPCRSTEDQVTYLTQLIEEGFQAKKQTVVVWVDLEKAFDRVWTKGLLLKLLKTNITHKMYNWIKQYIHNRKAKVCLKGKYSRTASFKQGVPQGGVLSPSLFLIFLNDLISTTSPNVKAVQYADDLALICSEDSLILAQKRLQTTLDRLDQWTTDWSMKVNATKTTYTVFSLSNKEQTVNLKLEGQKLKQDKCPTYLGITFDPRLTWKHQIEKAQTKGIQRLSILKKLAGTQWGANADILKKTYKGYVRPTLEYGMSAWGSTAPSNFQKIKKVQNQGLRLITGSLRSTPIAAMESVTGLQSLEQRRDTKILTQLSKFTSLKNHPMHSKVEKKHPKRLKRSNFLETARTLQKDLEIPPFDQDEDLPTYQQFPLWNAKAPVVVKDSIPGIARKDTMSPQDLETKSSNFINTNYPSELWIRVYTDGSAEEAVRNGGGGVLIEWPDGTKTENSIPTGRHSTNYKAEAAAIEEAVALLHTPKSYNKNIELLSDAKSVLQALHNPRNREHSNLKASLLQLGLSAQQIVLQWLPGHCNIWGNTRADQLAKEGSQLEQLDGGSSYAESKTLVKAAMARKWKSDHPDSDPSDPIHGMTRSQQTIIFRLRTGHNRLRQHMYKRFKVGDSEICPCGQAPQNTEHVLQTCSSHKQLRARTWPNHTPLEKKLYGTTEELALTVDYK